MQLGIRQADKHNASLAATHSAVPNAAGCLWHLGRADPAVSSGAILYSIGLLEITSLEMYCNLEIKPNDIFTFTCRRGGGLQGLLHSCGNIAHAQSGQGSRLAAVQHGRIHWPMPGAQLTLSTSRCSISHALGGPQLGIKALQWGIYQHLQPCSGTSLCMRLVSDLNGLGANDFSLARLTNIACNTAPAASPLLADASVWTDI